MTLIHLFYFIFNIIVFDAGALMCRLTVPKETRYWANITLALVWSVLLAGICNNIHLEYTRTMPGMTTLT